MAPHSSVVGVNMKKFYSCLPVFLLIGCAQVP
ncbi:invasion lipoprotein InvH, partial [Salmonella enterica]|nr:invasion lipoprotein InvH [Salmonella enterica]